MIYTYVLNRAGVRAAPRATTSGRKRMLGLMLDEKMFAFYYELSSNSR